MMKKLLMIVMVFIVGLDAAHAQNTARRAKEAWMVDILHGRSIHLGSTSIPEESAVTAGVERGHLSLLEFGLVHRPFGRLFIGLTYATHAFYDDSVKFRRFAEARYPDYYLFEHTVETNGISTIGASIAYSIPIGRLRIEPGVNLGYSWMSMPASLTYLKEIGGNTYLRVEEDASSAGAPMAAPSLTFRYLGDSDTGEGVYGLSLRIQYLSGTYDLEPTIITREPLLEPTERTFSTPIIYRTICLTLGFTVGG